MSFFNRQNSYGNQTYDPSKPSLAEFNYLSQKYTMARNNFLGVLIFTLINVIMVAIGSDHYFLFSATLPYSAAAYGAAFSFELGEQIYLYVGIGLAVCLLAPYILFWACSKKNHKWMIAALVYFIIDCIFLILLIDFSNIAAYLFDILFHAGIIYYLVIGIKNGKILKNRYNFDASNIKPVTAEYEVGEPESAEEPSAQIEDNNSDNSNGNNI